MRVVYSKESGSRKQRICLCSSRLTGSFPVTLYVVLGRFCIEKAHQNNYQKLSRRWNKNW